MLFFVGFGVSVTANIYLGLAAVSALILLCRTIEQLGN